MAQYKMISDKVLIRKNTDEEVTKNGLFIPKSAEQEISSGEVLAIGPGRWDKSRVPMTVKVGDKVWIGRFSGVSLSNKDDVVVREEEILAIEKEDSGK